ncbi:MAG: gamma-glutamylcyclotransferase [Desulfobacterales bacterium]|nr:gamma-glutamylcyclotransferase [Desulfobacterales bacterium]
MKIFVYGTLLKGMSRAKMLLDSNYLGYAMTTASLYNTGDYPGMKEGENITIGEIYDITEKKMHYLDTVEGYEETDPDNSLFIRKEIAVQKISNGEFIDAFAYFYNQSSETDYLIQHGDYRRYLIEQEMKYQWIIAYGSNMSTERLKDRIGDFEDVKKGFIEGYKLVFNKKAFRNNAVYANIYFAGSTDKCPAVAYYLSTDQASTLDQYEGVPDHYLRISIPFTSNNETTIAQVYIANPKMLTKENKPEKEYLNYIIQGYKEHGFNELILTSRII